MYFLATGILTDPSQISPVQHEEETRVLTGSELAQTIVDFARLHNARQIFLPRLIGKGIDRVRGKSFVNQLVGMADDMEVTIVADRRQGRGAS